MKIYNNSEAFGAPGPIYLNAATFDAGISVVCPRCGKHGPPWENFVCGATFGCPGY
jgi:hypothetical protein